MRKSKYGVSPKAVAAAVVGMGLECSERSAQGALKKYAAEGTTFTSVRAAAGLIAAYKREYGCYPRIVAGKSSVQPDALEREIGHAILLFRRLGFKVEVA